MADIASVLLPIAQEAQGVTDDGLKSIALGIGAGHVRSVRIQRVSAVSPGLPTMPPPM